MTRRFLASLLLFAGAAVAQDWQEGLRHYSAEDYEQAQRSFERALSEDPESSQFNLWVGLAVGRRVQTMSALRRLGAMPLVRRVKRQFERAVELDGSNIAALDALMGFLLQAPAIMGGSKSDARAVAERIQKIDPAHGAHALGVWHEAVGEVAKAGTQYELARQLAPDESSYLVAHAAYLARHGRHSESDELFEIAFARDPDNPDVWVVAFKAWVEAKRRSLYPRVRQLGERYIASASRAPDADPPSEVRALLRKLPK